MIEQNGILPKQNLGLTVIRPEKNDDFCRDFRNCELSERGGNIVSTASRLPMLYLCSPRPFYSRLRPFYHTFSVMGNGIEVNKKYRLRAIVSINCRRSKAEGLRSKY